MIQTVIVDGPLRRGQLKLPRQGLHLDDRNFYVDRFALVDFGTSGPALADEAVVSIDADIDRLSDLLDGRADAELNRLRTRANELLDQRRLADDPDAYRRVVEEARLIRQEMSRLRHDPVNRAVLLRAELDRALKLNTALADRLTDTGRLQFGRARHTAEEALLGQPMRVEAAEAAIEAMDAINREGLRSDPDFLIGQFRFLAARRHAATDPATFDRFVRDGASAVEAGDTVALLRANQELYRLAPFPADEGDQAAALAGLRR